VLAFLPLLLALQALCEEAVQRTAQAAARRGGWSQSTAGGGTAHSKTQAARLRATDLFPHSPLSVDTSCCARVAGAPLQTETRKRRSPTRIIARRARDDRTPRGGARARGGGQERAPAGLAVPRQSELLENLSGRSLHVAHPSLLCGASTHET